jgi:RNase P subunit RPR2
VDAETTAPPGACQLCGTPVPPAALTWMFEHTRRGTVWTCPACARTHLRAIESKLDQEYW